MALNYRVIKEEDVLRAKEESVLKSLLPNGEYEFVIDKIEKVKSKGGLDKNGNPKKIYDMLVVDLEIYCEGGSARTVRDWVLIVDSDDFMGFKLRHFALCCGLLSKYEDGTLDERDFYGKSGIAKIGTRDYKDNQNEMRKQNTVIDYIKPSLTIVPNDFDCKDIPF